MQTHDKLESNKKQTCSSQCNAPEPVLDQMHASQRRPHVLVLFSVAHGCGEPARPFAFGICPELERGRPCLPRSLPGQSPVEGGVAYGPFNPWPCDNQTLYVASAAGSWEQHTACISDGFRCKAYPSPADLLSKQSTLDRKIY